MEWSLLKNLHNSCWILGTRGIKAVEREGDKDYQEEVGQLEEKEHEKKEIQMEPQYGLILYVETSELYNIVKSKISAYNKFYNSII